MVTANTNPLGSRATLTTSHGPLDYLSLARLEKLGHTDLGKIPRTVKILLENVLRQVGSPHATEEDVIGLANWSATNNTNHEFPYMPARVLLQDFTGVPAVVDLAAVRSALAKAGADPLPAEPLIPVDLVIDHSVQIDSYGNPQALTINQKIEYERNKERYALLRWAQQAFQSFRVVPPGMGIVHQVNLEHLARVVMVVTDAQGELAIPDTLVGTDSHTPMVNGLGVLGWGVGGIEAEAAMLGQPMPQLTPKVVGVKLTGALHPWINATDLVLTITELLRRHGVVGKFVEFYGEGLLNLNVPDRATLSNMTPEYGATACLWPIDGKTLEYMRLTGRPESLIELTEVYAKTQGLWESPDTTPEYTEKLTLNLETVVGSLAGPSRPQDRTNLPEVPDNFQRAFSDRLSPPSHATITVQSDAVTVRPEPVILEHGSVVIAAITSCTNTSNPSVMMAAGLLAKKAVEKGLHTQPWVKTSLAPGSQVVTDYLDTAGLTPYLDKLGFQTVGYGCTTCIGNSGPLPAAVETAIKENDLVVASVLSGNRNFEGRIHALVRASYLASPPLVVAYALLGKIDADITTTPLGKDQDGKDVMLSDLWPLSEEIEAALTSVTRNQFEKRYACVFEGDEAWQSLPSPTGAVFAWDPNSTYVQEPPFFQNLEQTPPHTIKDARVFALLGDSITTDHISPAGTIPENSPSGIYLTEHGVPKAEFNSFGSRRGNHEVMIRGTFGNIRLRNALAEGKEGGYTKYLPTGEILPIFDASERYFADGTPLIILGGKEYGSGSSRDWAAKGTCLLGVQAVIAESYERIHRSNLIGMGVLPLQFKTGESASSLGLDGSESFTIGGLGSELSTQKELKITATHPSGKSSSFHVHCRVDSDVELSYYQKGGVLQMITGQFIERARLSSQESEL